ncbi:thiolase-like protein [Dissoconium aciculare CBS 342.82]|uniref:Thiolase-like protein n=1 Tax=Dissoconium aciculare CBS 342.82 TaxID=1314786 RepID=A0A6J3LRQ4_9PEZI|nr:thiolase-like protein [Dissoconium aciculare CBS 342.82]KAF1818303.1 thiolase-like protein [Dissoconium aciculare CBS 342.82]
MAPSEDPIAIIGTSCRVAGANNPAELWSSLLKGEDLQSSTDRMLLEVCWEAFESAGIALEKLRGSDTAVYAGLFVNDYGTSLLRDIDATPKYHSTGTANSIAANRVSYFFDLRGPSMVIDTACSSTITALHMASNALRAGDAQQAVVCGANIILNPDMFVTMSELGFLSPRGRCHSFDASGDGYARGEGVMAIVLKPLSQAIADNDPIRAIIRGSRLNQDGRTNGITLPSGEAQEDNIRKLYSSIGVDPSEVDYLEAHGTGTKVGDPIELGAIERVFTTVPRREKLIVGSIKCHVGHLEACAALIGIIKTIECLNRGAIPAQLHIKELNPKINFKDLHIPQELLQWPQKNQIPRLAGVNSFGFGGANGHVVLEQYIRPQTTAPLNASRPHLVRLSAETDSALAQSRADLAAYLVDQKSPLGDVSYMSLLRRSLLQKSQYFVASTLEDLVLQLQAGPGEAAPPVISSSGGDGPRSFAFVFTGQGAQWAQMGSMLVDVCPAFTETIDQCDAILASLPEAPSWSIRDELVLPPSHSHITSSRYSQPLCTALQLGLLAFCRSIGLQPKATVGHSSGEIAAAHAAGILSLRDAIIIAYYRGVFMSAASANKPGAMAAITMTAVECTEMLKTYNGRVDLACINSPSSCTISGDAECIDEIVARFKEEGIFCRKLRVDTAFHSHHMLPLSIPCRSRHARTGKRCSHVLIRLWTRHRPD